MRPFFFLTVFAWVVTLLLPPTLLSWAPTEHVSVLWTFARGCSAGDEMPTRIDLSQGPYSVTYACSPPAGQSVTIGSGDAGSTPRWFCGIFTSATD